GVTGNYELPDLSIKGEKGEVKRSFPQVQIKLEGNTLKLAIKGDKRKQKKLLNTCVSHAQNMVQGVQEPFVYKLKICASHFPMQVALQGSTLQVKNFVGEKHPREMNVPEGVKIEIKDTDITVESPDKELAGRVAGRIELLTRLTGKDRRIFQDGIYITEKA
ncbi:50S ribosomal protein L6, partial [Candidatus Woesearchaeota archaeon]|nr:50S ribosomal protein L6 [Candidatus Woesearchaeota archaeon]